MKANLLSAAILLVPMFLLPVSSSADEVVSANAGSEVKFRAEFYKKDLEMLLNNARRGDFGDFYQDVVKFARYGEKYPQYLLGLMLIKGDGVEQDIAQGLVWMQLSLEQKNPEWKRAYDKIVASIPDEQIAALQPMYEVYKERYGVDNQYMYCSSEKMESSNIRINQCRKSLVMKEYYLVRSFD